MDAVKNTGEQTSNVVPLPIVLADIGDPDPFDLAKVGDICRNKEIKKVVPDCENGDDSLTTDNETSNRFDEWYHSSGCTQETSDLRRSPSGTVQNLTNLVEEIENIELWLNANVKTRLLPDLQDKSLVNVSADPDLEITGNPTLYQQISDKCKEYDTSTNEWSTAKSLLPVEEFQNNELCQNLNTGILIDLQDEVLPIISTDHEVLVEGVRLDQLIFGDKSIHELDDLKIELSTSENLKLVEEIESNEQWQQADSEPQFHIDLQEESLVILSNQAATIFEENTLSQKILVDNGFQGLGMLTNESSTLENLHFIDEIKSCSPCQNLKMEQEFLVDSQVEVLPIITALTEVMIVTDAQLESDQDSLKASQTINETEYETNEKCQNLNTGILIDFQDELLPSISADHEQSIENASVSLNADHILNEIGSLKEISFLNMDLSKDIVNEFDADITRLHFSEQDNTFTNVTLIDPSNANKIDSHYPKQLVTEVFANIAECNSSDKAKHIGTSHMDNNNLSVPMTHLKSSENVKKPESFSEHITTSGQTIHKMSWSERFNVSPDQTSNESSFDDDEVITPIPSQLKIVVENAFFNESQSDLASKYAELCRITTKDASGEHEGKQELGDLVNESGATQNVDLLEEIKNHEQCQNFNTMTDFQDEVSPTISEDHEISTVEDNTLGQHILSFSDNGLQEPDDLTKESGANQSLDLAEEIENKNLDMVEEIEDKLLCQNLDMQMEFLTHDEVSPSTNSRDHEIMTMTVEENTDQDILRALGRQELGNLTNESCTAQPFELVEEIEINQQSQKTNTKNHFLSDLQDVINSWDQEGSLSQNLTTETEFRIDSQAELLPTTMSEDNEVMIVKDITVSQDIMEDNGIIQQFSGPTNEFDTAQNLESENVEQSHKPKMEIQSLVDSQDLVSPIAPADLEVNVKEGAKLDQDSLDDKVLQELVDLDLTNESGTTQSLNLLEEIEDCAPCQNLNMQQEFLIDSQVEVLPIIPAHTEVMIVEDVQLELDQASLESSQTINETGNLEVNLLRMKLSKDKIDEDDAEITKISEQDNMPPNAQEIEPLNEKEVDLLYSKIIVPEVFTTSECVSSHKETPHNDNDNNNTSVSIKQSKSSGNVQKSGSLSELMKSGQIIHKAVWNETSSVSSEQISNESSSYKFDEVEVITPTPSQLQIEVENMFFNESESDGGDKDADLCTLNATNTNDDNNNTTPMQPFKIELHEYCDRELQELGGNSTDPVDNTERESSPKGFFSKLRNWLFIFASIFRRRKA